MYRHSFPAPLAFLEEKREVCLDAIELRQPSFVERPEALDAVDMHPVLGEMPGLVDAQMPVIAYVHQTVVAAQAGWTKEAFIHFHDAGKGGLVVFLAIENRTTKAALVALDRLAIETQKLCRLGGREAQTKAAHNFFWPISG